MALLLPRRATTPPPAARSCPCWRLACRVGDDRRAARHAAGAQHHARAVAFSVQPDVVWGLIAALFIANFMLLLINIPMVGLFVRVLLVPSRIPYADGGDDRSWASTGSGSTFDLMVMIAFGVLGYMLRKLDVPLVPVILGVLLGNEMEDNLRRALQSRRRVVDPLGQLAGGRACGSRRSWVSWHPSCSGASCAGRPRSRSRADPD